MWTAKTDQTAQVHMLILSLCWVHRFILLVLSSSQLIWPQVVINGVTSFQAIIALDYEGHTMTK